LGFEAGNEIGIFFDSMLAKVIAWGEDRASGQRRLHYALSRMACLGLKTNLDYLLRLLQYPAFQQGDYDTQFLQRHSQALKGKPDPKGAETAALLLAATAWAERHQSQTLLPQLPSGWRNNPFQAQQSQYQQGETIYTVHYRHLQEQTLQMSLDAKHWHLVEYLGQGRLVVDGHQSQWQMAQDEETIYLQHPQYGHSIWKALPRYPLPQKALAQGAYLSSMPAVVLKVLVEEGQTVAVDDTLLILSSMKMETRIKAHTSGKVSQVLVKANEQIAAGTALVVVEP
jgi:propionyl-CoA carboxylase alpha chain